LGGNNFENYKRINLSLLNAINCTILINFELYTYSY